MALLNDNGANVEIIEYLKTPLTSAQLKDLLKKLKLNPNEVIRTKEPLFKSEFQDVALTDAQWLKVLRENPILLERPIADNGHRAVIGRPIEEILTLL